MLTKDYLIEFYLNWFNNFLTVKAFAKYHGMTEKQVETLIDLGKELKQEREIEIKS